MRRNLSRTGGTSKAERRRDWENRYNWTRRIYIAKGKKISREAQGAREFFAGERWVVSEGEVKLMRG
jgi:hypothetical protein